MLIFVLNVVLWYEAKGIDIHTFEKRYLPFGQAVKIKTNF